MSLSKNRKIKILEKENLRLHNENRKLKETSCDDLGEMMAENIEQYKEIIEALSDDYKKLHKLQLLSLKIDLKYNKMFLMTKLKHIFRYGGI